MRDDYIRSRGFALTLARRAVVDLRRDEFRQLRNYVDLCQALARKTRYNAFFTQAQQMLQQTDSPYYALIRRLLDQVDGEYLCTFGVNFGLGGVLHGAARLRAEVEQTRRESAWLNTANCAAPALEEAVGQAERAGRYAWVLYAQDPAAAQKAVRMAECYPYTAFLLVAAPEIVGVILPEHFDNCRNLCICLLLSAPALEETTVTVAGELRDRKQLFGFAILLGGKTAGQAMDPVWLNEMANWVPFCLYARMPGMDEAEAGRLRNRVVRSRSEADTPLLVFDWDGDLRAVNQSISSQAVVGAPVDAGLPFPFSR